MSGMSNRIFVDSSILVEYSKNTKTELLEYLISHISDFELCISETVLSEYTFHFLAKCGDKSPLTLKRDVAISNILSQNRQIESLLGFFKIISGNKDLFPLYLRLMQQYNLLPNDALILATCLNNGIKTIASFDTDFKEACQNEGILLISDMAEYMNLK